jgi:uncharacterized protein with FMN-binding domain
MQNATAKLLFLLIVTGALFTACAKEDEVTAETDAGGSLEESVMGGLEEANGGTVGDFTIDEEAEDEGADDDDAPDSTGPADLPGTTTTDTPSTDSSTESSVYKDGTYNATGSYQSPAGAETVGITLVVKDDVVTSVSVSNKATNEASINFQNLFAEGVSAMVVGKSLDSLGSLGAVNGSSLTPNGFESAVATIAALAKN